MSKDYTDRNNSLNQSKSRFIRGGYISKNTYRAISEVETTSAPGITKVSTVETYYGGIGGSNGKSMVTGVKYQSVHEEMIRANREQINNQIDETKTKIAEYTNQENKVKSAVAAEKLAKQANDVAQMKLAEAQNAQDAAQNELTNATILFSDIDDIIVSYGKLSENYLDKPINVILFDKLYDKVYLKANDLNIIEGLTENRMAYIFTLLSNASREL